MVYLEDGEIAIINRDQPLRIMTEENVESKINICKLKMSISELEKGGYPHFMLKEIFEQPKTLLDCLSGRVSLDGKHVAISGIIDNKERFLRAERVIIVACGTSWHAGLIGKHLIEDFCRIPVVVEYASEFRYSNPVVTDRDILIAISQSGETADTLAALELAKSHGAFVFGICNVIGSSIPRATHSGLLHTRRTRDRRSIHEGIYRPGYRAGDDSARRGQAARHDRRRQNTNWSPATCVACPRS